MRKLILFMLLSFYCVCCTYANIGKTELPEKVDLSESKYFPPVGNQGYIGACDWFAAVYYQMTYSYNKQYQREALPENTFSPKFGYNILNNAGKFPYNIRLDDVYKFVQKHGSATMADWVYDMALGKGYTEWCTDAEIWRHALAYRIEGYKFFTLNDAAPGADYSFNKFDKYFYEIKKLLADGEVLVIQSDTNPRLCVYKPADDDPGTEDDDPFIGEHIMFKGSNAPDHTMAMVGYNDHIWIDMNDDGKVQKTEKGAFKIADSFGVGYFANRNKGFFWMPYCIVESSIYQHRVNRMFIRDNYQPEITCKITLNTYERDKIRFQFGWAAGNNQEAIPDNNPLTFDPYGLGYEVCTAGVSLIEGGNFAFDGGEEPCDGSFTFDLTDIYNKDGNGYYYFRIDNTSEKPTIIKTFEITEVKTGVKITYDAMPYNLQNNEACLFLKL